MLVVLPVDPEVQRAKIISKYERDFYETSLKFTDKIKQRTLNLMKFVCLIFCKLWYSNVFRIIQLSVKQMETYPSEKIVKILPAIDPRRRKYLVDAYRFIRKEKVHEKLWIWICMCNNNLKFVNRNFGQRSNTSWFCTIICSTIDTTSKKRKPLWL